MRLAGVILLCLVVGGWLAGSVLRRAGVEWGASVSFFAGLFARFGAAIVFALIAVRAIERGGVLFDGLAVLTGFLAIMGFAVTGVVAWTWVRLGRSD